VPTNGAVEGWRFAVADESATRFPRTTATFGDVCPAGVAVAPGTKRVAVYVDYGVAADAPNKAAGPPAPTATCVSAPAAATGTQVLTKAVGTRVVKQQVCGIDGYPTSGCGDPVANPPSFPNPEPKVTFAGTGASSSPTPSPSPAPSTSPSVSPSGGPVISPSTSPSTSPSIRPAAATGGTGTSASSWVLVGALIAAVVAAASWLLVRTRGRH